MLRLHPNALDIVLLVIYFVAVLGIGFAARRSVGTSADFLLAGRSLPAWVTGLAFISANLGATEILGMAANGAQYGVATVHYYWIGAVPAMVFLGIVMMPFYFRSKVRSVPEFLRVRYNDSTHVLNAAVFALSAVLIAGVNLYALAIVLQALLGINLYIGIVVSAVFVLAYIGAGGLSSAIYGEVLQFFVILAGLIPLTVVAVRSVGGFKELGNKIVHSPLGDGGLHAWHGTSIGASHRQPDRRELDRHRVRPRVRAVLRVLDDQLHRGAAGAVGEGPVRRPAHPADRRLPEAVDPRRGRDPRPGRAGRASRTSAPAT